MPAPISTPNPAVDASASSPSSVEEVSDRRADVEAKQSQIATLLAETGCEGLLVLDPGNFAWLTSGAISRGNLNTEELPGLYYTPTQRWLLASNVESQRLFDEEIHQLGFMLKEWPWHWGREQLLADLIQGKRIAGDTPFRDVQVAPEPLRGFRRVMSAYEQACYKQLGQVLVHAVEATCRSANPGDTERELAGQLCHRLVRRGALPVTVGVAADGRSQSYRRFGFTPSPVHSHCVVTATARKYGLYATASRSFSFGPPDEHFKAQHLAASKIAATYVASSWPDALPSELFNAGKRIYQVTGFEHEWLACPQGCVTGRQPVELNLGPETRELFRPGWAVVWEPSVGAASSSDTFLVTDAGPQLLTPTEVWPLINVKVLGTDFPRPHILER